MSLVKPDSKLHNHYDRDDHRSDFDNHNYDRDDHHCDFDYHNYDCDDNRCDFDDYNFDRDDHQDVVIKISMLIKGQIIIFLSF